MLLLRVCYSIVVRRIALFLVKQVISSCAISLSSADSSASGLVNADSSRNLLPNLAAAYVLLFLKRGGRGPA